MKRCRSLKRFISKKLSSATMNICLILPTFSESIATRFRKESRPIRIIIQKSRKDCSKERRVKRSLPQRSAKNTNNVLFPFCGFLRQIPFSEALLVLFDNPGFIADFHGFPEIFGDQILTEQNGCFIRSE